MLPLKDCNQRNKRLLFYVVTSITDNNV